MGKTEEKPPLFASTPLAPNVFCRCEITDPDLFKWIMDRAGQDALRSQPLDTGLAGIKFGSGDWEYDDARQSMYDEGATRIVSVVIRISPNKPNSTRTLLVPLGDQDDDIELAGTMPAILAGNDEESAGCLERIPCLLAIVAAGGYGGVMLVKALGHLGRILIGG